MTPRDEDGHVPMLGGLECYRRALDLLDEATADPETLRASVLVGAAQAYAALGQAHATAEVAQAIQATR